MKQIVTILLILSCVLVHGDRRAILISRNNAGEGGGGGSPTEVTDISGLAFWYKPDTLLTNLIGTTVIGENTNIVAWGDSSGNNHVITTNNPTASAPTYQPAAVTGISVGGLVFGSGQYLRVGYSAQTDSTIFMTWRINSAGTYLIPFDGTNSSARQTISKNNANAFLAFSGTEASGGAAAAGEWYVQCAVYNSGGNDSLYTNGVAISTALNAGNQSLDGLTVGASQSGVTPPGAGGYVCEIVGYNRNLNATEIGQVSTIMKNRAGL